ncbi:MAG: hypothetical protein WCR06_06995 [bacterium]
MKQNTSRSKSVRHGLVVGLALLAGLPSAWAENEPAARFRGPLAYDFGVTNITWEAGTEEYSFVTFDLSWSYSWRAKWKEPAATSATGKDMELENWDAAWVFVKFLPEKDSKEVRERNHWQHATLDSDPTRHVLPAGATNCVKLSDDGTLGTGVFIYRDAVGHGVNDWKKIRLRWIHPRASGKFNPAKAAVKVHAISMVYVPEGPFKVGSGAPSGIVEKFSDGPDMPLVNIMASGRPGNEFGGLTDGAWRGGPSIPLLLDAAWNGPAAEGTHARRFGIAAGDLWGTHTYWEVNVTHIGGAGVLNDEYPTGYEAFYCMKYDLTQGQYVDFLNSLPPDVAAERAFVGSEVSSDAGMHTATVKIDMGPGRDPVSVVEKGGCTIFSSAEVPDAVEASSSSSSSSDDVLVSEDDKKKKEAFDNLVEGMMEDKKGGAKKGPAAQPRPVYTARLPYRRLLGVTSSDTFAYGVWAGLRPMSQLEGGKAGSGARDPIAAPDWTQLTDLDAKPELLDEGLPTERYLRGNSQYGCDFGARVGCRSTPTSDRGVALATYWGVSELGGPAVGVASRGYRGTHGNGIVSPGKPGASFKRTIAKFTGAPADWPEWWAYIGGHFVGQKCRLVTSADNRIRKPAVAPAAPAPKADAKPASPLPPVDGRQDDLPRVANVKVEPGKEYSTVSFDLSWKNSWRAKWTEPADKNCTGKPLPVESWDAAWVFLKFRKPDTRVFSHATLSPDVAHQVKPAGAALDMGLDDDGNKGIGVFIYRDAVGQGASDFKGVKLRWLNGSDQVDASTAVLSVHAIAMVYVPEGPFRSKSPFVYPITMAGWTPQAFVCQLTTIETPDATKLGGHVNFSTNYVREASDWPNGYGAFYCMKYSILQGEYARFLTEVAPDLKAATYNGEYGYQPHNAARRYSAGFYGLCGYTIRYVADEMRYEADAPERPAKFLTDPDIHSFTAWAGLRPMSNLEYEKVCRGPRAVARDADAWAPGTCAPAAGLASVVPSLGQPPAATTSRLTWPRPSYWGIRDLSLNGSIIEWPAVVKEDGRGYKGNHGTGTPDPPGGWVFTSNGEWYYGGMWQGFPLSEIGVWLLPEDFMRMPGDIGGYISTRCGRYGARAVRTAAVKNDKDSPLQVEALPNLAGYDIAITYLTGRVKNDGDKPLQVELVSAFPAACFPLGAASRVITAAPKSATPFKILTTLTPQAVTEAFSGARKIPLRIQVPGGEVLGKQDIMSPKMQPANSTPPVISSLEGGAVALRITNATDRLCAVVVTLQPVPGVKLPETERRLDLAAGAGARVVFPVPRQGFPSDGVCPFPFRVAVAGGAPQSGTVAVELSNKTRWWVTRRSEKAPNLEALDTEAMPGAGDATVAAAIASGMDSGAEAVFTAAKLPAGWTQSVHGAQIQLGSGGPLPSHGAVVIAATRLTSPTERDVIFLLDHQVASVGKGKDARPLSLKLRIVLDGQVLCETRSDAEKKGKPDGKAIHLRKGASTLLLVCQSMESTPTDPGVIGLKFTDAKDGKPVSDLLFDMVKKE